MKILVDGGIYSRSKFGGSIRFYNQLINGLSSKGASVDLLLQDCNVELDGIEADEVRFVNSINRSANYDIFHTSYFSKFDSHDDAKVLLTIHDMIDELLPPHLTWCGSLYDCVNSKKRAASYADHIVAISNTTKEDIVNLYGIKSNKISVIYHGLDKIFLTGKSFDWMASGFDKLKCNSSYILHVGGREGYKNFQFLLEAYARSRISADADLLVVGSQDYFFTDEKKLIQEYKLQNKVYLTGYISDEFLKYLYLNASLMVMPSLYEGFGYPMLEALSCGTTIACSSTPALVEVGQGIPFVFDPTDIADCINVLEEAFYGNSSKQNTIGMNVAKSFTIEKMVGRYVELFDELLD